jgi:predicted RNA-binding protein YlqC (UPF0109 family)
MEKTDVKLFVRQIAEALCEHPEWLEVEETTDERGVLIMLYADKVDLGRLIGKKGETVNAVRNLLRALGSRNDARYSLKIDDLDKIKDTRSVLSIE